MTGLGGNTQRVGFTTSAPDILPLHGAVITAPDPQTLAGLVRPLTADEAAMVDSYLAELGQLGDEDLAAALRIPASLVPEFRRLMFPARATVSRQTAGE